MQTLPRRMIKHSKQLWTLNKTTHSVSRTEACKWANRKTLLLMQDSSKVEWILTKIWCRELVILTLDHQQQKTTRKKKRSCYRTLRQPMKSRRELYTKNTSRNQRWRGKEKKRHSCSCRSGKVKEMAKQLERRQQTQKRQIWKSKNFFKPNLQVILGYEL